MDSTPTPPPSLTERLQDARRAKAAKESADEQWRVAQEDLRRLLQSGSLSEELEREVRDVLGEDERPHHPHRYRPAPS